MVGKDLFAEVRIVEMEIYLRGGDALVSEHLLYGSQIGSAFEQMCCERMPQGMRRDSLTDAGLLGEIADLLVNRLIISAVW